MLNMRSVIILIIWLTWLLSMIILIPLSLGLILCTDFPDYENYIIEKL